MILIHSNASSHDAAGAGVPSPRQSAPATIPHDERRGCWPVIALTAAFWIGVYLAWRLV